VPLHGGYFYIKHTKAQKGVPSLLYMWRRLRESESAFREKEHKFICSAGCGDGGRELFKGIAFVPRMQGLKPLLQNSNAGTRENQGQITTPSVCKPHRSTNNLPFLNSSFTHVLSCLKFLKPDNDGF
jgi:hypothetical protein